MFHSRNTKGDKVHMYRKFIEQLRIWEKNKTKEPLLVTGARQVGKTWLIKEFCKEEYVPSFYE